MPDTNPPDAKRFLEGSFAPVTEEITAYDLPVSGQLPAGLNGERGTRGKFIRNGLGGLPGVAFSI